MSIPKVLALKIATTFIKLGGGICSNCLWRPTTTTTVCQLATTGGHPTCLSSKEPAATIFLQHLYAAAWCVLVEEPSGKVLPGWRLQESSWSVLEQFFWQVSFCMVLWSLKCEVWSEHWYEVWMKLWRSEVWVVHCSEAWCGVWSNEVLCAVWWWNLTSSDEEGSYTSSTNMKFTTVEPPSSACFWSPYYFNWQRIPAMQWCPQ